VESDKGRSSSISGQCRKLCQIFARREGFSSTIAIFQCFKFRIISSIIKRNHRLLFVLVKFVRRRKAVIRAGRSPVSTLRGGRDMCPTKQAFIARAGHTLDGISLSADYPTPRNINKANRSPTCWEVTVVERPTFFFVFVRPRV
jgi:hypothetical protein